MWNENYTKSLKEINKMSYLEQRDYFNSINNDQIKSLATLATVCFSMKSSISEQTWCSLVNSLSQRLGETNSE